MKKTIISMFFFLAVSTLLAAAEPNFGADGLNGINAEQKKMLTEGKIVFSTQDKSKENSLIEAVIVFNQPIESTWSLLTKVDAQDKYLSEIKKIKLASKDPVKVEFGLKISGIEKALKATKSFVDSGGTWTKSK